MDWAAEARAVESKSLQLLTRLRAFSFADTESTGRATNVAFDGLPDSSRRRASSGATKTCFFLSIQQPIRW